LLEVLKRLPLASFEELVFKHDMGNAVPGKTEAQAVRAMELVRLFRTRQGGLDTLWAEIRRVTGTFT